MNNNIERRKDQGNILKRYKLSFFHAIDGIKYTIAKEHNMIIIIIMAILATLLGIFLKITTIEFLIVIILISIVTITEFINTAIEAVVDLVTLKEHPLAKIAKDTAAGATLIASLVSLICGIIIYLPKILSIFIGD